MVKTAILALLMSIRAVESSNGATSRNELQITPICIQDVNRIYGTAYSFKDAFDRQASEEIAILYLSYWGEQSGQKQTAELYSRIWNGGPDGWKKKSTVQYWKKVRKHLHKLK